MRGGAPCVVDCYLDYFRQFIRNNELLLSREPEITAFKLADLAGRFRREWNAGRAPPDSSNSRTSRSFPRLAPYAGPLAVSSEEAIPASKRRLKRS